jgi:two-component system chemotaxis response regulator CheB
VDDSSFFRGVLAKGLSQDEQIDIVGTAVDAQDAERVIKEKRPDVLTLDVEMPGMNGIDFLKKLMSTHPLPVVMVSSLDARVFDILAAGAVDFVQKPKGGSALMNAFFSELASKIKIAAVAKLITKRQPLATHTEIKKELPPTVTKLAGDRRVLAFGASTGGTDALVEVLQKFPPDTPGIVVTQHMPPGFTKMFADRLNRLCPMTVKEAEDHDQVVRGRILLAPGGFQMSVEKIALGFGVRVQPGEKMSGHCPSVDYLFLSVAKTVGRNAVGVIMTGMGSDGANGLLAMRQAGAYTLGQDKESCVVYGMPAVAHKKGGVCKEVSLDQITREVLQYLKRGN